MKKKYKAIFGNPRHTRSVLHIPVRYYCGINLPTASMDMCGGGLLCNTIYLEWTCEEVC